MNNFFYISDIESTTLKNEDYRRVLYTTKSKHEQLVLMSLLPGEEIGAEIHKHADQFIRIEKGQGQAILTFGKKDTVLPLNDGSIIIVPRGVKHNIINTSHSQKMKLYTIYSPKEHEEGEKEHFKWQEPSS